MKKVIFGKTRSQWKNIWLYGKVKYLIITASVLLVGYFIYTVVTNTPADFKIATVGELYIQETESVETYVKALFPEFKKVDVSSAYLSSAGKGELDVANMQKAMILITVSGEDVIVVDKTVFDRYYALGAFKEVDGLFAALMSSPYGKSIGIKAVNGTVAKESGGDGKLHVYGIDLSKSQLLNAIGIYGREQILTISVKSDKKQLANDFIMKLINDSDKLSPKVTLIPEASPTPIPTKIPTGTSSSAS